MDYGEFWQRKYIQYAIGDEKGNIIGFEENTPPEALEAARKHIEMCRKFDDITNYGYWDDLLEKLHL